MSTVVAYTRVSTDDQTCENQRRTIAQRFPEVGKWFSDDGVSGTVAATQRPGLGGLLAYVREGDTVVVAAIDRLGRNTIDVLHTVEALTDKSVSVVSLREGFDLATPAGKLMLTMLAAVAELERENLKARQLAGLERAKALQCPALFVSGARDQMTPPKAARGLAQAMADARSVTLPACGHAMMAERPDLVLDALKGFLPAVSPGGPSA